MTKLTALFLVSLTTTALSLDPVPYTINTKKWSHVLDDHFISITVNPTDLLQGRVYGLQMNSTMAILKGLAPAYVRIGSADTAKYTFKTARYPSDVVKPDDEYTVTETHWMVFNEVAQQAGLDVIVCLNSAHRSEGTKKWDPRNSLELISFSDSQGYNLTWQLGYEVQTGDDLSGIQFGKDLNRLRTILNAFPRYQHAKLIGPDIRIIHKKEDIDFWNDVLLEAGPTLDSVTWHPRWPQPSKMKVSDNSELGYEFPIDYLEWDRVQLGKILQKSIFKNPVWIGETKRESTGTFAEGLIWARRLVLAAKLGVEVVMKQPNLMDVTHPKPEYWIALLHKRLLGKSVLETKNVGNNTDLSVITHCTNPFYWSDKPEKLQDGSVSVYAVNMGGLEQKIQMRGTWNGKSQMVFQYVLTSGSDPDSVFSQMTYLNGEPLMMTDDGLLPDIVPKIKKLERGLTLKLPPYSVGFWVVPEAKVKICQIQQQSIPTINIETLTPPIHKPPPKTLENIRDINQFMVEKLKNPESDSEEVPEVKIEVVSAESSEKDVSKENTLPRVARKIREAPATTDINQHIKKIMQETQEFLSSPQNTKGGNQKKKFQKASRTMEDRIQGLAEGISDAIKFTNQEQEFNKFLEDSGLKQDFGSLIMKDNGFVPEMRNFKPYFHTRNPDGRFDDFEVKERLRRSISDSDESSQEYGSIEEPIPLKFAKKDDWEKKTRKQDESEKRHKKTAKRQDGKRKKIIKRKNKHDEPGRNSPKVKPAEKVNDIQEEIIKKEIELLEKTEETVADILKTQKKRQETFEDIIFEELNDVKGERIRELEEMHRSQRKNSIVKRQAQTPLSKPLIKTVEYIEKNFNLEPESVRKIKRSLEERMGEILRNYDTKKSMEVKKRLAPPKEERKIVLRKSIKETDRRTELPKTERQEENDETKERPKEKNVIVKKPTAKTSKRPSEEPIRKPEEPKKKHEDDSFELFNEKKIEEVQKTEKTRHEEGKKPTKKTPVKIGPKEDESSEEEETKKHEEKKEDPKTEKETEPVTEIPPLKNDKERREHMLEQISLMVDKLTTKEKKLKEDDDISVEFESDRRPRGIKRRPRRAEASEELIESPAEAKPMEVPEVETTIAPTTLPPSKLSKLRKLRLRQTRKFREPKKTLGEEALDSLQRKRHLTGFERPLLELEKKKQQLIKPKFRRLNPKFQPQGNVLGTDDKPEILEIPIEQEKAPVEQEAVQQMNAPDQQEKAPVQEETLQQMPVQEETLQQMKTPDQEVKGADQEETLQQARATDQQETLQQVKPPEQETPQEKVPEQPEMLQQEEMQKAQLETTPSILRANEELKKDLEEIAEEKIFLGQGLESSNDKSERSGKESSKETEPDILAQTPLPAETYVIPDPTDATVAVTEKPQMTADSSEEKGIWGVKEIVRAENDRTSQEAGNDKNDALDSLEDDLSSEDVATQIRNLETELGKTFEEDESNSSSVEDTKPEDSNEKLQKDGILDNGQRKRRATFLPNHGEPEEEDYSSEERIQKFKQMIHRKSPARKPLKNDVGRSSGMGMGADEFLRMAGSTVRVMFDDVIPEAYGQTKNKIQNMGLTEYIKEFGNIVQQMKNLDQIFLNIGEAAVKGYIRGNREEKGPYIQVISRKKRQTEVSDELLQGSSAYARTSTEETITSGQLGDWEDNREVSTPGWETGTNFHEDNTTGNLENPEGAEEKMEVAEKGLVVGKEETKEKSETNLHSMLKDNAVGRKMVAYVPEDLQEKIFTPWIKTTKDFIQQALTTLKRQRELSEILANDLMNRDITKKAIGKRETGEEEAEEEEEAKLPVYHMVPPSGGKKREAEQKLSDQTLIRQLRGLQPGVYVVPTEEMTNIRSEQITSEAKQKSGMPNVVTLNIYYDKKNAEMSGKAAAASGEMKMTPDTMTYYQNKGWNSAAGQYNQGNRYMTVPDVSLPVVSPMQVNPSLQTQTVFAAEPRVGELPNSRLIQYPSPAYHYPPVQKMYPSIVPNPQPVYGPVYYLPQETRYPTQSPGTKRQWREFKSRSTGVPGWNVQYEVPSALGGSSKTVIPSSYNKNFKFLTQDKKRSVAEEKVDPKLSETALPFWKFFTSDKKAEEPVEKVVSGENESSEDVFVEKGKKTKAGNEEISVEEVTEGIEEEIVEEVLTEAMEEKSRRRRSADETGMKRSKRSSPYVSFRDHDILPEWFGTYREIENGLENFPPHVRRSHIVSTPWSEEDEELLSILEADDELSLLDHENDDYYYSDNNIQQLRRYPRSTDENMIKTNMIFKTPADGDRLNPKMLGMTGIKKLTDEDSSLEVVTKSKPVKTTPKNLKQSSTETVLLTTVVPSATPLGLQPPQNMTALFPRNPQDDTFYFFFKYAYDSFVKVMKSMTEFF